MTDRTGDKMYEEWVERDDDMYKWSGRRCPVEAVCAERTKWSSGRIRWGGRKSIRGGRETTECVYEFELDAAAIIRILGGIAKQWGSEGC